MKKFKFKSLAVSLFILCGIGGAANLYKDELIHFFTIFSNYPVEF